MSRYLLMTAGFLLLIFRVQTGSFELEMPMGLDTSQEELTHKESSTWSRMPDNELHAHRLCDAYWDFMKSHAAEAEEVESTPTAQWISSAPIKKDTSSIRAAMKKHKNKEKAVLKSPAIKYDATDDRSKDRFKCLAFLPLRRKQKVKESYDRKPLDETLMIKVKDRKKPGEKNSLKSPMNHAKMYKEKLGKKTSQKSSTFDAKKFEKTHQEKISPKSSFIRKESKEKLQGKSPVVSSFTLLKSQVLGKEPKIKPLNKLDAKSERVLEINSIYNEYLKAWQQPYQGDTHETPDKPISFSGLKLSALTDLLNVIENFQKGDLVRDLTMKIKNGMAPNLVNQVNQDDHLVSDSRASLKGIIKNDLSGLFDNMKPSNASTAFKAILADVKTRRNKIKAGQLYDEYKKGFSKIFKDHKYPRQLDIETANTDLMKSFKKKSKSPSKMSDQSVLSPSRNNEYMKALKIFINMNKESNKNGGTKPYYLPDSKIRQLVHNDIPLIRPVFIDAPMKSLDNAVKSKTSALHKETSGDSHRKDFVKQASAKQKESALKTSPKKSFSNPWKGLYFGLDPNYITNGVRAINNASFFNLLDEYQRQVESLNRALRIQQGWWKEAKKKKKSRLQKAPKRNIHMNSVPAGNTLPLPFPEALINQGPQTSTNVLGNMASQLNVSPVEMAQRIVGAGQAPAPNQRLALPQMQIANQLCQPQEQPPQMCQPQVCQQQPQQHHDQAGISPVLDKILNRLEAIQATKCNNQSADVGTPCCFVDPADGAPCDLNGSWESLVLGIRINIKSIGVEMEEKKAKKPPCAQPKATHQRRQCVKLNNAQLKEKAKGETNPMIPLKVCVQETVPPRAHELLDNLTDWQFSGNAQMILGGPISLSFRKANSNFIGHFVGYCRTCGCLDTIFGSWTFCQPSRDCQDISMSIVDRRDMLRRFSLDEKRKNRYKEQLYLHSKLAKMEKERVHSKQGKVEKQPGQCTQ